ncbi:MULTISPECIES: acetyl-CoA carboxylase biotin carboxyl carrier protein [Cetobacterium]|uniref:Biotin/lipoyl-containing protein n=1 Tax=Candidatus Cetobacterium colombiensis TaxID=3073100 RepID=A0ABU4W858_9FUSO|nr:biotin/lipoyl-containing protein [Candidatus Cetobacterium colombiensis]MDX8335711.1 biotin/lipoyl-containing protein [Candidatus Cetobacterium colombiensis]
MKKEEFQIEDLINVLSECGLTEISYEENENLKIKIKKSPQREIVVPKETPKPLKDVNKKEDNIKTILSPGIGKYFYKEIVKVGDKIKVGQDLGYIYVMGLKTPLKSTVGGEVTEITVQDGGVVDYGKVLLKVKATAR